jgi:predicted outer membrane repeat protein
MKGDGKSNENVIINQTFNAQHGKHNRTVIQFYNVSYVNISTLTMRHPSIIVNHSLIAINSCRFYGYTDTKESISYINITGRYSQALLDDCTFKENCFIISDTIDGITVSNSIFRSYNHHNNSIITVFSSVVKITGNVNFTDSIKAINPYEYSASPCGTAILLRTINPQFKSSLNITSGATVNFVNLTCKGNGGALYSENGLISIGAKAQVVFMNNVANTGGAILLKNGEFKVQFNTNLNLSNNFAYAGGAIGLINSTVHIIHTDTINFDNNMGAVGGAMYIEFGTMNISSNSSVTFKTNNAYVEGGAIHIERGVPSSIIVDDFAELLFLNNSAFRGGALYMKPSSFAIKVGYYSSLKFVNNTALHIGGAMYSEMQSAIPCAFMITDYSAEISFRGNHANGNVGHHMYGSSVRNQKCDKDHLKFYYKQAKPYCWKQSERADGYVNISFDPGQLSSVSSAPRRACLCDANGKPQCANFSLIFTNTKAYRGEIFTLPACVVGYNFGTTVGTVYARFLHSNLFTQAHLQKSQYNQLINDSEACTKLKYSVSTISSTEILLLQTSVLPVPVYVNETDSNITNLSREKGRIHRFIANYVSHQHDGCISESLLRTPIFINITLLPGCPQGLILNHNHAKCRCYPVLAVNGFRCSIQNKIGYLEWNNTGWVNATINDRLGNGIIYNSFCPLNYCKSGKKMINIRDNPWRQCASNRTGVLCGACIENFSLAIGSPRCIECHNRRNMTLLLVFAIAGVFLVFFILTLDFTVTQGHVNGLIFYANIVWTYKTILFPITRFNHDNNWVTVLNIFIAWLNLDFGIESCFIVGLNAYWKTWMQFIFPFYIWTIAGVITVICHYSSRLTNLIGSRAVPLLATLFLLSYMKLLRTVVDATSIAMIEQYPENTSYAVWYLDGNLRYCHGRHTYLFVAAVLTFVFLWLPYTFLLLFIQPLRKLSHLGPLRWVHKFTPIYDAYLSPLNDEHQYWFGITLLVRGVLLVVLTMISSTSPKMNLFVILAAMTVLVVGLSIKNVYKQMTMRALESIILLNLIVWSAGTLYKWESIESKMIIESVSIGIVFAQFWLIVVCNLIKLGSRINQKCARKKSPYAYHIILDNEITHERIEDPDLPENY